MAASIQEIHGPVGFVSDRTIDCALANVHHVKTLLTAVDGSNKIVNRNKIKARALLEESLAEHQFGLNVQTLDTVNSNMKEYVHNKRKLHMKSILQNCVVPFYFKTNISKDYAQPLNLTVDAGDVINMIKIAEPPQCLRSVKETKTVAGKNLIRKAVNACKGERSNSNRSFHKPDPYNMPQMITIRSPEDSVRPASPVFSEDDNMDDINGLVCWFTFLENGAKVNCDEWVAYSSDDNSVLIGLYRKSDGRKSLINTTVSVSGNHEIFQFPCECTRKRNESVLSVLSPCDECCLFIWIPTGNILRKFPCPILTHEGLKLPERIIL